MDTFETKLGKTRAGERTRIWIEGRRLIAAGFTPGQYYAAHWDGRTLTLECGAKAVMLAETARELARNDGADSNYEVRLVSGKGEKPIIDITGARVAEFFGKHGTHVRVAYGRNVITIQRAK